MKEDHPDEALEKLQELEKRRVEERMTLKHKGAGKWAKMQAIRSKYDEEVSFQDFVMLSLLHSSSRFSDYQEIEILSNIVQISNIVPH